MRCYMHVENESSAATDFAYREARWSSIFGIAPEIMISFELDERFRL